MNKNTRLARCIRYRLRGLTRASLIYLAIFLLVDLVLPTLVYLVFREQIISGGSTFQYGIAGFLPGSLPFLLSTMIFLFVGAYASFREDFNHLLAMNNTRMNQYWSTLISFLTASVIFVVIGNIVGWLEIVMQAWIKQENPIARLSKFFAGFGGENVAASLSGLLLCLVIFLAAGSFGEIAGILSYRFSNIFVIPFWICFGTSFIVVPILAGTTTWFKNLLIWFFGYGQANSILISALHLLVLTVIFKVLSLLFIRKLPQSA
jgi:hypothetical protein